VSVKKRRPGPPVWDDLALHAAYSEAPAEVRFRTRRRRDRVCESKWYVCLYVVILFAPPWGFT
jgi:hypothetical protein